MSRLRRSSDAEALTESTTRRTSVVSLTEGKGRRVSVKKQQRDSFSDAIEIMESDNAVHMAKQLSTICGNVDTILNKFQEEPVGLSSNRRRSSQPDVQPLAASFQFEGLIEERDNLRKNIETLQQKIEAMTTTIIDLTAKNDSLQSRPLATPAKPVVATIETQTDPFKTELKRDSSVDIEPGLPAPKKETIEDVLIPASEGVENLKKATRLRSITAAHLPEEAVPKSPSLALLKVHFIYPTFLMLLETNPHEMLPTIRELLVVVRRLLDVHNGYEALPGNTFEFMAVFTDTCCAVGFANQLHVDLLRFPWPKEVLSHPDLAVRTLNTGDILWRGLPCSIGITYGRVGFRYDEAVGRAWFYGADADALAQMMTNARMGETLITNMVLSTASNEVSPSKVSVKNLEGLNGVVQMLPLTLSRRRFTEAPPRLNAASSFVKPSQVPAREPMGKVALAFTDVPFCRDLFDASGAAMSQAIISYHKHLRDILLRHNGVEVRTDVDAIMSAFHSESEAVLFALELQTALHSHPWEESLLQLPYCKPKTDTTGVVIFTGLRVRTSIHSGYTVCIPDPTTNKMDYWGTTSAIAAKLCGTAEGGQVVITEEAFDDSKVGLPMSASPLPEVTLAGVKYAVKVLEIYPSKLARRKMYLSEKANPSRWESSPYTDPRKLEVSMNILQNMAHLVKIPEAKLEMGLDALQHLGQKPTVATKLPPLTKSTIVFIEISDSEDLWEANRDAMSGATALFKNAIQNCAAPLGGYVAGVEHECWMVAFHLELDAIKFSLNFQECLLDVAWPPALLHCHGCNEIVNKATGTRVWRGLRTCISCHSGHPTCLAHPVTGRIDYWGNMVYKGLSIGALASPGEILLTADVWHAAQPTLTREYAAKKMPHVIEFPFVPVKKLKEPVHLVRITHPNHTPRPFPDPRRSEPRVSRWHTTIAAERSRVIVASEIMKRTIELYSAELPQNVAQTSLLNLGAPVGNVTLVFTDIQSSTLLWEKDAAAMLTSIQLHNKIMRETIEKHNGYEVKTEGDAFMVAFHTESDAALFCLAAQVELVRAPWSQELISLDPLTEVHCATTGEGVGDSNHLWRGLRMRMGAHMGCPTCLPDPVSGRMDYWGPMVNKSARISSVATGGQVVFSKGVLDKARGHLDNIGAVIKDLKTFELKGIAGTTQIFQVLPRELRMRVFTSAKQPVPPPLKKNKTGRPSLVRNSRSRKSGSVIKQRPPLPLAPLEGVDDLATLIESSHTLVNVKARDGIANTILKESSQGSPLGRPSLPGSRRESIGSDAGDPLATGDDNFAWTNANSKYVDLEKISHAAAINKIIAGGLMPEKLVVEANNQSFSRLPSFKGLRSEEVKEAVEDLRRQMEEDSCVTGIKRAPSVRSVMDKTVGVSVLSALKQPGSRKSSENTGMSIVEGLHKLEKRLSKKRRSVESDVSSVPDKDREDALLYEESIKLGLLHMLERLETQKMEQEDKYLQGLQEPTSPNCNPASPAARVTRAAMMMTRLVSLSRRKKIDLWDQPIEIMSHNQHNERLGFTLLHHQISRLHTKVKQFCDSVAGKPVTPEVKREYIYQCLLCVNPHNAKIMSKGANIDDAVQYYANEVLTSEEASRCRIGVTRCRASIVGMVLQWADWIGNVAYAMHSGPASPILAALSKPPLPDEPPPATPPNEVRQSAPRMSTQVLIVPHRNPRGSITERRRTSQDHFPSLNRGSVVRRSFG